MRPAEKTTRKRRSATFRETRMWLKVSIVCWLGAAMGFCAEQAPRELKGADFVHPGMLHTKEDLARIKAALRAKQAPIYEGFQALAEDTFSRADYKMRGPFPQWGRDVKKSGHKAETEHDANAAYQNALMWAVTKDRRHGEKAMEILNAWSTTLKKMNAGDVLASGLQGFKFANAAELMRHTDSGWPEDDAVGCEKWLMEVWYPIIKDYAHYANANWEGAALRTILAIAVYCDDRELFESAVRYAVNGAGNGRITHTIVYPSGQGQESSRTQAYAQLGAGLLSQAAEVAWNQGVDLYGWADNRILAGFEYTAKFGLGEEVPYQVYLDRTGKYGAGGFVNNFTDISQSHRGRFQPIYEMVWNHYEKRRGIAAPYTRKVAEQNRPERVSIDHPGFGTIAFSRQPLPRSMPTKPPGTPAGLVARGNADGIKLTWVNTVEPISETDALNYSVKRGKAAGGPYVTIGGNISSMGFVDREVKPGQLYYYKVSAFNQAGESGDSAPLTACAGLPAPWNQQDIGTVPVAGYTEYDGQTFTLEGAGQSIGGINDQFHFAYVHLTGDGTITAEILEPISSQRAVVGVMMRNNLRADSRHASVLLRRGAGSGFVTRASDGNDTLTRGEASKWVRLKRTGNTFTGCNSANGKEWHEIGTAEIEMSTGIFVGLPVCSGLKGVSTTATYAHVNVTN